MDLVMDPVDLSGDVPRAAYRFITGSDTAIPKREVDQCSAHFIPLALADLDPVRTQADFCRVFDERSRLQYKRFGFQNYIQHRLVRAMMLLRAGGKEEGHQALQEFCRASEIDPSDKVLTDYARLATDYAAQQGHALDGPPSARG